MTIGRVGLTAPLTSPATWAQNGDAVSITGRLIATNKVHADTLRQQLAAYADGAEDDGVVPVTWAEDPTVDGFYRVTAASFATASSSSLYSHVWDYRVDLERVRHGWRVAAMESIVSAAWSSNAAGRASTNARPWVAVPGDALDLSRPATTHLYNADTDAHIAIVDIADVAGTLSTRWALTPAAYYHGSARLIAAATGAPIVGTQPNGLDPYGWVLANGSLEVRLAGPASAVSGNLETRWRIAGGWSSWKPWFLDPYLRWTTGAPPVLTDAKAVRVLRNDPAEVIVRILAVTDVDDVDTVGHRHTYDLALRRGSPYLVGIAKADRPTAWSLTRTGGEAPAGVAAYGGTEGVVEAAATDADGLRYVITSPRDWDIDTYGGVNWQTGAVALPFTIGAVGANVAASAVTEDAARQADRAMTAQGERVQSIAW
jgi:hypothetical protein